MDYASGPDKSAMVVGTMGDKRGEMKVEAVITDPAVMEYVRKLHEEIERRIDPNEMTILTSDSASCDRAGWGVLRKKRR